MNESAKERAAGPGKGSVEPGNGSNAPKNKDPRGERLAAALRANLLRRKAAQRAGLGDFDPASPDSPASTADKEA